jgi:hypothetical protein
MPLLVAEAFKLSRDNVEKGVIEEIIDIDELFALLPFMQMSGRAYVYHRENTLTEADFLSPYDTVNEGAATFTEITTTLKIMAGDVDMDKFLLTTQSDWNPQLAIQLASKAKGLGRAFRRAIMSFDGIAKLTDPARTILAGTNGAAVTFSMLDELKDLCVLGPDCFMMRRGTWRAIRALLRSFNGNTAETVMIPNFGRAVPSYEGIPVILNDFCDATEVVGSSGATTCSIYALRLNEVDGFHAIFGGPSAGIQVEEIGTVQNKDAVRYRVKWYVGTCLKASHGIARLAGVTNV